MFSLGKFILFVQSIANKVDILLPKDVIVYICNSIIVFKFWTFEENLLINFSKEINQQLCIPINFTNKRASNYAFEYHPFFEHLVNFNFNDNTGFTEMAVFSPKKRYILVVYDGDAETLQFKSGTSALKEIKKRCQKIKCAFLDFAIIDLKYCFPYFFSDGFERRMKLRTTQKYVTFVYFERGFHKIKDLPEKYEKINR